MQLSFFASVTVAVGGIIVFCSSNLVSSPDPLTSHVFKVTDNKTNNYDVKFRLYPYTTEKIPDNTILSNNKNLVVSCMPSSLWHHPSLTTTTFHVHNNVLPRSAKGRAPHDYSQLFNLLFLLSSASLAP